MFVAQVRADILNPTFFLSVVPVMPLSGRLNTHLVLCTLYIYLLNQPPH